ncbi:MAG TPA: hypothetical protein VKV15_02915 [Bryobacteraceae bacterium]|nr:hypothetical protein [Bryobacteraceae bacterium]
MNHWTDDELLDHLYGLKADESHLAECSSCSSRAKHLAAARERAAEGPEITWDALAEQRRNIYRRLGEPLHSSRRFVWATSLAVLFVLMIGLTFLRTKPESRSDDQFYSEVSAIVQNPAPQAVQPIESLIEE